MGCTLTLVELGWIFQALQPSLVHLLGYPALVADVGMAASLIQHRENTLYFRRAVAYDVEPWTFHAMRIDVSHGVFDADFLQSGAFRIKMPRSLGGRITLTSRIFCLL